MEPWMIGILILIVVLCVIAGVVLARRKGAAKPAAPELSGEEAAAQAAALLAAVGGPENVAGMAHCSTRVRFTLKRYAVDEAAAKAAGAQSVVRPDKSTCQVLLGPGAPQVYDALKAKL